MLFTMLFLALCQILYSSVDISWVNHSCYCIHKPIMQACYDENFGIRHHAPFPYNNLELSIHIMIYCATSKLIATTKPH